MRKIRHCSNCMWRRWLMSNNKCKTYGVNMSNFKFDSQNTVTWITERDYQKQKKSKLR